MSASVPTPTPSQPVAIVCVGMAGSGKTTFMQRLVSHLYTHPDPTAPEPSVSKIPPTPPYILNLDPAVHHVPFTPNIDIRDSVNYKEVMKQFNLGPNGGILTSLNLFSTKIDQVINLLEKRTAPPAPAPQPEQTTVEFMTNQGKSTPPPPQAEGVKHILVDTPGQIEVFVWSASGEILLSSMASTFPTVIAYVIDTPRTTSTSTFMSNMLYACSILYKTKLPMILVFNKTDAQDAAFAKEWMTDFEAFQAALKNEEEGGSFGGEGSAMGVGSGYMGSLLNSMSLVLDEFYKHLSVVGVSSLTGDGISDFFKGVDEKKAEFERDYRPELERRRAEREKQKAAHRERELDKLMKDMNVGKAKSKQLAKDDPETVSDAEDQDDDDDNVDMNMQVDDDSDNDSANDHYEGPSNNESLAKRYKEAFQADDGDMSFARYVQQANIG
jgi:GTPase SAR1 family protein